MSSLSELDRRYLFHPMTALATHEQCGPAPVIVKGEGAWLEDAEGRRYLDAMAGLWCVNVGYGRREIAEALELRRQGVGELCMGEVGGVRPEGFDFGNSPYELSQADVEGKTLIHSTMAGTVGVTAAEGADEIYLGSLVLAAPTAKRILARGAKEVSIVAMGGGGEFRTDEDEQCALYIRNLLQGRQPNPEAVRSLVLSGGESQKFGDPAQPHFITRDLEMALQIDSVDFAIRVQREDGLLIARPEPA